jgi:hypothetical protein
MSNGFQGNQPQLTGGDNNGLSGFFSQIMLMPFSTITYSMQIFMWLLQGMMRMTNEGVNAMVGGTAQTLDSMGMPASAGATASGAGNIQRSNRKEEREMSEQSWGGGPESSGCSSDNSGWTMSEKCKEIEPCDRLRLVRYKILFLKRDLEVAFPEQEELVVEEIPKDGFISWKIAEFIQQMSRGEVRQPGKWREKNYPPTGVTGGNVTSLPDKDKRFLRVYCHVLDWYERERLNQVDVLKEIRDRL